MKQAQEQPSMRLQAEGNDMSFAAGGSRAGGNKTQHEGGGALLGTATVCADESGHIWCSIPVNEGGVGVGVGEGEDDDEATGTGTGTGFRGTTLSSERAGMTMLMMIAAWLVCCCWDRIVPEEKNLTPFHRVPPLITYPPET